MNGFVKEQVASASVSVQTHCPIRIGSEITLREYVREHTIIFKKFNNEMLRKICAH